jgi:AbiV family abortive infection protein
MAVFEEKKHDENFMRIVENSKRLAEDATVLRDSNRHLSATILAVLAIEELGKAIIRYWGVSNIASKRKFPTHVEKQSALFALLSAYEMYELRELGKLDVDKHESMHEIGPLSSQFAWARAGFYDHIRMSATYADDDPDIPHELISDINETFVNELQEFLETAIIATRNSEAMELASIIYQNDLGRL